MAFPVPWDEPAPNGRCEDTSRRFVKCPLLLGGARGGGGPAAAAGGAYDFALLRDAEHVDKAVGRVGEDGVRVVGNALALDLRPDPAVAADGVDRAGVAACQRVCGEAAERECDRGGVGVL